MIQPNTPKITTAQTELETIGYKQELTRTLTLWQLTAFGLNYMIPISPALIFGFIMVSTGGTVALPYLLAGVGMLFTANSYALMIQVFPVAGSLYSYVSRSFSPHIGFIAGWVLLLDYILIPSVTAMGAAEYTQQIFPHVPYLVWLVVFAVLPGLINILGVELMSKLGLWMLVIGEIVIIVGFIVWSHAVANHGIGVGQLFSSKPFAFISISALATGTSMAVLNYLGFDAITTLTEEAINPHRDIPRAIFLSVIIGTSTMFLTGYLGMLVISNWQQYIHDTTWQTTALFHVAQMTGGRWFSLFYTSGFLLAMLVFNVVATAAGSRLLFGMGRDNVLPKKLFGAINKRFHTPHFNIILIIAVEYIIGSTVALDHVAELVNYGALVGFLLLNISVVWMYYIKPSHKLLDKHYIIKNPFRTLICPLLGVLVMLWVISGLHAITIIVGTIWLALGVIYGAIHSKGYRVVPGVFRK